jgi:hypothetical protein
MAPRQRRWLQCNIPLFLDGIVLVYLALSFTVLPCSMLVSVLLSFMTLWALHMAALSHPGPIRPWEYDPVVLVENGGDREVMCKSCELPKPPRTHHCRQCDECIARYDHHCDWIDNCVGASNYKCFFLFIFYIMLCILHYMWSLVALLVQTSIFVNTMVSLGRSGVFFTIGITIYTFIVIPCGILAAIFLVTSVYAMCRNETTFEQHYDRLAHRRYGRGVMSNLKEVLGQNVLLWPVPTLVTGSAPRIFAPRGAPLVTASIV